MRPSKRASGPDREPDGDGAKKPYGFVLVLRGLARAAIALRNNPSALRVLCVASEYMNQDGACRISQGTIAARLEISRQAVNRHLALLDARDILVSHASTSGVTRHYALNTEGLEYERAGQYRVDERRAAKRARIQQEPEGLPSRAAVPEVDGGTLNSGRPFQVVAGIDTGADRSPQWGIRQGVFHQRFGFGVVEAIDGNAVSVNFSGTVRKVVSSFLEARAV